MRIPNSIDGPHRNISIYLIIPCLADLKDVTHAFLDLHSTLRCGSWCFYFSGKGIKKKEVIRLVKIGAEELHSSLGFSDVVRTSQHTETCVEHMDTLGYPSSWRDPHLWKSTTSLRSHQQNLWDTMALRSLLQRSESADFFRIQRLMFLVLRFPNLS